MNEKLSENLEMAVRAFRRHMASNCNRCFQGIYCPEKYRLQVAVCDAERAIKESTDDLR